MTVRLNKPMEARTIGEEILKPGLAADFRIVAIVVMGIPTAVRWFYLAFAFTLPYDNADLGFMSGSLSVAKISGLLFVASYFFYYGLSRHRSFSRPPHAMGWFLTYIVIFALGGLFEPPELADSSTVFTFVQLLVFFWISSDLLKDEKMARRALLIYAIAGASLAFGMVAGLPGFSEDIGGGREGALGASTQNLALALVIFVGLAIDGTFKQFSSKVLAVLLGSCLLAGIVANASRSVLASFIIGCLVFLLPHWRARRTLISIILATLGIGVAVYVVASNPQFAHRWGEYYYEGEVSGRDVIYPAAIEMISERPIFGWHPISALYELGRRVGLPPGKGRDAHNLVFDLLLSVGVVGAIPFLIGLWLCWYAAWRARRGALRMLPLALIMANLAGSITHTNLTSKPQWFVFGLAFAAASFKVGGSGARRAVLFTRRSSPPSPPS